MSLILSVNRSTVGWIFVILVALFCSTGAEAAAGPEMARIFEAFGIDFHDEEVRNKLIARWSELTRREDLLM